MTDGLGLGIAIGIILGLAAAHFLHSRTDASLERSRDAVIATESAARDAVVKAVSQNQTATQKAIEKVTETITAAVERSVRVVAYPMPFQTQEPQPTESSELGRDLFADRERVPDYDAWFPNAESEQT